MVPSKPIQTYQPRVYGFRVNEASVYYTNRNDDVRQLSNAQNNNKVDASGNNNNDRTSRRTRRVTANNRK